MYSPFWMASNFKGKIGFRTLFNDDFYNRTLKNVFVKIYSSTVVVWCRTL